MHGKGINCQLSHYNILKYVSSQMKNPLSLLPLFLMVFTILGSILAGFFITNSKKGTIQGLLLITGVLVFLALIIFQWLNIHWMAEEGDLIAMWLVLIFYGFNSFQPLRIKNQFAAKSLFVVIFSPMVVLIPYLFFLTFCTLRWLIPYFLEC
jgi:hypothetical protein